MARTIFYSWQNDLENKTHRYFIEKCLKKALKMLEKEALVYVDYDRDTKGVNGSPDITTTIFEKINKSVLFICDISIINSNCQERKMPNPNVLIELGYAASNLGWDKIICLFDSNTGNIEDLPFDIRQKRITLFDPHNVGETERISKILADNIKGLFVSGQLFNPLTDYMKGKIDHNILSIAEKMSNLVFGTLSLSDGLSGVRDLMKCDFQEIEDKISNITFPAYLVLNNFDKENNNLRDILKDLFSSNYFPKEWSYIVLEMIDWIRSYNWLISKRSNIFSFNRDKAFNYNNIIAVNAHKINPHNPENSFLILEVKNERGENYVDSNGGKVINFTNFPTQNAEDLIESYCLKKSCIKKLGEL